MTEPLYGDGGAQAWAPAKPRRKALTAPQLRTLKGQGHKLTMVTCYDYTSARLVNEADIDIVLVGDSLGNVMQGEASTLPVTMDQMVYHARCVRKGLTHALLVGDMPFLSYQVSVEEAVRNAGRFMAEAGCNMVKLEGGAPFAEAVRRMVQAGIPVMGHLGLTPQSVNVIGGYKVQGKSVDAADQLLADAHALEDAGACSLVLELVPAELAARITAELSIPTIGIGAGVGCDGQVLVWQDLLGMQLGSKKKMVREYADLRTTIVDALNHYAADVRSGTFPGAGESF